MNCTKPQIIFAVLFLLVLSCKREVSREIPYPTNDTTSNPPPDTTGNGGGNIDSLAGFTLSSSNGSCSNANVQGVYISGVPLTESNKVTLDVLVTSIGQWSVTTKTVNGMFFSDAGIFADTGLQTITLLGVGTPGEFGNSIIPVATDSSTCGFAVTVAEN